VDFEYRNVKTDKTALEEMLTWSKGERNVPVIVEGGEVIVGFGGT